MLYTNAPVSTLYAKVNIKRKPYSNDVVSIRIIADTFPDFTANKAQYFIDLNPNTASFKQVELALANLQTTANARKLVMHIKPGLYETLIKRNVE